MSESPERVTRLEHVETDIEKAAAYKKRLAAILEEACKVCTEASGDKITLGFNLQKNAMGQFFISTLVATKEL